VAAIKAVPGGDHSPPPVLREVVYGISHSMFFLLKKEKGCLKHYS